MGNPRDQVASIVGPEMEEQLEDMWQCDKEGEVRGLWKPIRRKSNLLHMPASIQLTDTDAQIPESGTRVEALVQRDSIRASWHCR